MERLPTEVALTETTRKFKSIKRGVDHDWSPIRTIHPRPSIGVAIVVALVVWLLNWLYLRSSKERAFVRTGFGGQKVVVNGGALVLPIVHEVIPVNMNTLRLEVSRGRERALITKDRMRVDVTSEFYVRVQASEDAIAAAAQTLGQRTMQPDMLKELVEGKFVDALRTVAAEMTMEEMHEKRGEYVKRVRAAAAADLLQNGLELETVSLTQLDQTAMEFFNPSNAFDAEGLTRLTETIETRKKKRNDIEQDTMIQIRNKNLDTERQALDIDRELEYARLSQERELEVKRAVQRADVARQKATSEQESERAQITAREAVERARIASERAVEEERIDREREHPGTGNRPSTGRSSSPSSSAPSRSPSSRRPSPRPRPPPTRRAPRRSPRRRRSSPCGRSSSRNERS